jgi:hypothetical protein
MSNKNAVIIFSFPEPDDALELGAIIQETKKFFEGRENVKAHLAVNNAADQIISMFDPSVDADSNLVQHARRELALAGNDAEFNTAMVNAVRAFASYGHSGGSASIAIPMLNDLLCQKNLTPLTDASSEWNHVGAEEWPDGTKEGVWQNCRNSEAFSKDGGKTYTLLSDKGRIYHSDPHDIKEEGNGSGTESDS